MSTSDPDAPQKTPIRILALDGGGVRGLSSLLILRQLMQGLEILIGKAIRPCECFDLIIGTGTGGISALFLGRLHMSVDEAIREYAHMAHTAFKPAYNKQWPTCTTRKRFPEPLMSDANLKRTIDDIVDRFLGKADVTLAEPSQGSSQCRTAVLATQTANVAAPPSVIRSYPTKQPASLLTISEATRATASTAGLFAPVALGYPSVMYGDAGLSGYNNPAEIALQEAELLWPGVDIDCMVSLGTGFQKIVSVGTEWKIITEVSKRIIESCELIGDRVFKRFHASRLPYFRFNVDRGLEDVNVTEWNEAGAEGKLTGITESYMRWGPIDVSLNSCISTLNEAGAFKSLPQFFPLGGPAPVISNRSGDVQTRPQVKTRAWLDRDFISSVPTRLWGKRHLGPIEITLTVTPKNVLNKEFPRIAWEVFHLLNKNDRFQCKLPSDLAFGSVLRHDTGHYTYPFYRFCPPGYSVAVSQRNGRDIWKKPGRQSDATEGIKAINASGVPKTIALGSFNKDLQPHFQPFYIVPKIKHEDEYLDPLDLVLQVYRTYGCEKGQTITPNKLSENLYQGPVRSLKKVTTWRVLPQGDRGLKLRIVKNS